jgi:hypothetical protein
MHERYARNASNPILLSGDADTIRASQRQHVAQHLDRHIGFSRPTFVYTQAQAVADPLFPSSDRRLDLGAPVVAAGFLPSNAAGLGDAPEVQIALCRRDRSHIAEDRQAARRHNRRRFGVTLSDRGVDAILIVGAIGAERRKRTEDLILQGTDLGDRARESAASLPKRLAALG